MFILLDMVMICSISIGKWWQSSGGGGGGGVGVGNIFFPDSSSALRARLLLKAKELGKFKIYSM